MIKNPRCIREPESWCNDCSENCPNSSKLLGPEFQKQSDLIEQEGDFEDDRN